ncbi:hypothetical protein CONLIGDRAFT_676461 [Coniochaeta ligniaria NRRL 30616]|uniref:C3H1-type domain-containing protein n=1 Tax=Coniochaeta ligniaria NRRL 30616 TaxID=1408157 RepID=A0A1J7K1G3_9PEZI|nr:hypothetical protein CONLIGDRAFT_676461 [Coniochaeta ligniaria NRRL 30616]
MPPRIHHFIVRPEIVKRLPTGLVVEQHLVPLIPFDELPEWLDVVGIPRQLTPEQTTGLSNLGCFERQGVHDVEIIIDEAESDAGADDAEQTPVSAVDIGKPPAVVGGAAAQPGLQSSRWADAMNDNGLPCKPDAPTAPTAAATQAAVHPADRMIAHISPPSASPNNAPRENHPKTTTHPPSPANSSTSSTPSPTHPKHPPKKRNYCRHWVHHGTCKWGPYCRFAHAMPATPSGLAEVGLRDFPSWWTAAVAGLALCSPSGAFGGGARKLMPYRDMGGMGYGYGGGGMPGGFVPGYGMGGGPGAGGYVAAGGRGWKEGEEVHPQVRSTHTQVQDRERVRRVRGAEAGAGGGVGVPGMRNLGVVERQPVAVARGSVAVGGGEDKRREGVGREMRQVQEQQQHQQVAAQQGQHKLVDV